VQKLSDRDFASRSVLREQFFATFPNENPGVILHLKMSDEAHYELSGCVNTQRVRYWSDANPHEVRVQQIQSDSNSVRHHWFLFFQG
jgi:hypothetical protein